jgi:TatA/E family protein of Tat protein translocase
MPFGIQPIHILIIVLVALLVFGPKRLPEIGRSIGQGMREFKRSIAGLHDEAEKATAKEPEMGQRSIDKGLLVHYGGAAPCRTTSLTTPAMSVYGLPAARWPCCSPRRRRPSPRPSLIPLR